MSDPRFAPLSPRSAAPATPPLVLVADDNQLVRTMLRVAIERSGFLVLEAEDGRQALELYRTHRPACVVTDILMPEKEGLETITELRAEPHRAPIIAMSGESFTETSLYLRIARDFGADVVLEKPFSIERLLMHLDRLIRRRATGQPEFQC